MSRIIRPFETLLVANRGEIAQRIMATARRMGLRTVAVYSEADRSAPYLDAADTAVSIGAPPPRDSYLNIPALLDAARRTGAQAVHPGYGFLAENAAFAEAVNDAGLVFVGPDAGAIRAMGNKAEAKLRVMAAGMPCVPGYQDDDQSEATLAAAATRIGFPIMIKAAAGGGGRGMRLVEEPSGFAEALRRAASEAEAAFGDRRLILERAVIRPRHVEIQILADTHGHVIALGERDCSVQRRHQKLIEEAPSPAVDGALRARMQDAAVTAAAAIGYSGAGTMEFLLDASGAFYFMEMNTRLQVEHAVTEAITGLDLVEWQLRIAAGEPLTLRQEDVTLQGHAIEVRLVAEDVPSGFLPQTGTIARWRAPGHGVPVRVDAALADGMALSPFYDSMIAKLIVHGETREEARRRMLRALEDCVLLGVPTNRAFLAACLAEPDFAAGEVDTGFIARHPHLTGTGTDAPPPQTLALAALVAARDAGGAECLAYRAAPAGIVFQAINGSAARHRVLLSAQPDGGWLAQVEGTCLTIRDVALAPDGTARMECDGLRETAATAWEGRTLLLLHRGHDWRLELEDPLARIRDGSGHDGILKAPLSGRVVSVSATAGQAVRKGEVLLVMEAMKMEHMLVAPFDGTVGEVLAEEGAQLGNGQRAIVVVARETEAADV